MTRRPEAHVTGDIALGRVMRICEEVGWACEIVHKDYGEDLLVQPQLNGRVDDCRIWFQVKGTRSITRFRRKGGEHSIPMTFEHASRWVRTADLVVVVLWDLTNDVGYWTFPQDYVDQWDLYFEGSQAPRLYFEPENELNVSSAQEIGWIARIKHYEALVSLAMGADANVRESAYIIGRASVKDHRSVVPLIVYNFLQLLGIVGSEETHRQIAADRTRVARKFRQDDPSVGRTQSRRMALMLLILGKISELSPRCGLTAILLDQCTTVADRILRVRGR